MQDTTLSGATLQETVFTGYFEAPWSVAISAHGHYWAMGSRRGEARVWRDGGKMLSLAWQAHTAAVQALAFSPDEQVLATGSWDGTVKLWNLESGALLWMGRHTSSIQRLAFTPDVHTLASAGDATTIPIWAVSTGTPPQTPSRHSTPAYALALSPDGSRLASGSSAGTLLLWDVQGGQAPDPRTAPRD